MFEDENDKFQLEAFRITYATREALLEDLAPALSKIGGAKIYTFRHRFKSSEAIVRKVLRKRLEGKALYEQHKDGGDPEKIKLAKQHMNYEPRHVTDAYGCRYVTLYQSDIPGVVAELLQSMDEFNHHLARDAQPIQPVEFVIYTNRTDTDPLSIVNKTLSVVRESKFANLIDKKDIRPPENRKSAYSSVHFVFARSIFKDLSKPETEVVVRFEIQLRDIFEEGWGEVQHRLLYSEKDNEAADLDLTEGGSLRKNWELHLNALKTFVDGCSQHASIIKQNLEELRASATPIALTQSITRLDEDRQQIQKALRTANAPREAVDAVTVGYSKLLADNQNDKPESRLVNFQAAANSFDKALSSLPRHAMAEIVDLPGGRPVEYHLEMEAAAARALWAQLLDEDVAKQVRAEAVKIYRHVLVDHDRDPIALIRLGKLLERESTLAALNEAVACYDRAIGLIDNDKATGAEHWVAISVHIDRGVAFWKLTHHAADEVDRVHLLRQAIEASRRAYDVWQGQLNPLLQPNKISGHKACANTIYFLAKLSAGGTELSPDERKLIEDLLVKMDKAKVSKYSDYYKTIDNMMLGYVALGQHDIARQLAYENYGTLRTQAEAAAGGRPLDERSIAEHLSGSARICFLSAADVIRAE